jgi:Cu/Ag efflux pump CusA
MPTTIDELNNIPIQYTSNATVFLKDIGQVRDGSAVQQNIVREDGKRAVLLSVIKNGNASTLAVVNGVRKVLQVARQAAPPGMSINELFDQSKLVTSSIFSLLREGAIAAGLTALMILLFLGSWRSTLIVMVSIPLSILTSIVCGRRSYRGRSRSCAAVGILVTTDRHDRKPHRLLAKEGNAVPQATLYGSAGIAVPTLVSTLAIAACSPR